MQQMKHIFTILIWLGLASLNAQQSADFSFARGLINEPVREVFQFDKNYRNELVAMTNILFLGYKSFISSQDINACVFHPSCSVYAMTSIRNNGFSIGFLAAFDRMARCNGLSVSQYEFDFEKRLLLDPVP
jgi:putative component of membrane protein insertase Oxa1/YidC/SpoIIIJ protein YidD